MYNLLSLGGVSAYQEVLWLDIPVDEVAAVHVLDAVKQLHGDHEHRLE